MEQMMKLANNEHLSDKEFGDEVFLMYTDKHRKRYDVEHRMITKHRNHFKSGNSYGFSIFDIIFPKHLPDSSSREEMFRQRIEMERMEKTMKKMEKTMKAMEEQIKILKEKKDTQEVFYECQPEQKQ